MSFYSFVVTKELYEFPESMFFSCKSYFIQNIIHVMPNFLLSPGPFFYLFISFKWMLAAQISLYNSVLISINGSCARQGLQAGPT
jgi:hypothetical protein